MTRMVFLAHLPTLRITEDEVGFAGGALWRMPFDVYNSLSLGAFEEHRRAYLLTEPVFYRVHADLDVPVAPPPPKGSGHAIEMKVPSNDWAYLGRLGLEFVLRFQWNAVARARAALLLAAPASGIPDAALSVTFVRLADPGGFRLGDQVADTIRVQGDADQEYLFLAEAAAPPLPVEVVQDAEGCLQILDGMGEQPELIAATRALLDAAAPTLSPMDQLVLAVRAIEGLLLPDITRGLGRTFAQRLSSLLALDAADQEALHGHARTLYDARSASLHSEAVQSQAAADTAAAQAHAEQLLAAAIRRLAERRGAIPLPDRLRALDEALPADRRVGVVVPVAAPHGLRRPERTLRPHCPIVANVSSAADMGAKDGTVSWSPLIGLGTTVDAALRRGEDGVVIMTLTGSEMVSLEERDTARDFIGQLHVVGQQAAVLSITAPGARPEPTMPGLAPFLRRRDLATVALRLAGFHAFHDPELLGVFVYQDSVRTRFPAVFRQTIEQQMRREPAQTFTESDVERVGRFLDPLIECDKVAPHPQIDHVLRLFRRCFGQEFLPEITRAALLLSAVEAMLGRFRKPQELEGLVAAVVRGPFPDAATWFQERGRSFRNTIAHGPAREQDPRQMAQLVDVVRGLIPPFVQAWLARPDRGSGSPLRTFLETATTKEAAWRQSRSN